MALATLVVDLILKAGGFESDMGRASKTAQKRMKEIEAGAKKMGIALGTALAAGATALGIAVKGAIDRADEIYNTAHKIGVTTEALSGLEYAAKQADVGLEELQGNLAKMVKFQAEAAQGGDEAARTFAAFGIAIKDSTGHLRDSQSLLLDWAQVFAGLPDGAEKSALAMRVFGKSGADMIPFLNEGKNGISDLIAEAKRLGLVISDDTGEKADAFNDTLGLLKGAVDGIALKIAEEMLPALQDIASDLQVAAENGQAFATVKEVFDVVSTAASLVAVAIQGVVDVVQVLTSKAIENFHLISAAADAMALDVDGAREHLRLARQEHAAAELAGKETLGNLGAGMRFLNGQGTGTRKPAPKKDTFPLDGTVEIHPSYEAQAAALLANAHEKEGKANSAAAAAKRAAAEAAREQAERERELQEAIEKVVDASADFRKQAEDLAAERAGPQAEAALDYKRNLEDLRKTAKEGEIGDAELAAAEKDLAAKFAATTAEIEKRLNPGKQVLDDLQFQIDLTKMLTDEERDRAVFLRENINATQEQADAYARMQGQLEESREAIAAADQFRGHWEDAFAGILDGTKSVKDAFSDLAQSILADIARMIAQQWVEKLFGAPGTPMGGGGGGIMSFLGSLFGSAKGNVFDKGVALTAFANGGIVDRPTIFPMARGMGLMGEAGPEAVVPLQRMANGKLGVQGGKSTTINISVEGGTTRETAQQIAMKVQQALALAGRAS